MKTDWIRDSVKIVTALCAIAGIVECAASDERSGDALRLICSAAAASSLCSMAIDFLQHLF